MFTLILLNTLIYFVYLKSIQDTQHGVNNRTLIFDNNNLSPRSMEIADFSSPETDSGRAWLQPIGQEYEVEEVHVLRNAHLALHPNITRFVLIKCLLFYPFALVQNISFCPQFLRSEKRSCLYFFGSEFLGSLQFFLEHRLFLIFLSFLLFTLQTSRTKSLQLCRRRNGCYSRGTKSDCDKSDGRS